MHIARSRRGFTLIELVVVVLILGIIAAVAAPKMFDTANDARENSTRHNLSIIRDALQMYRAREGSYPAVVSIQTDLADYFQGPFPAPTIGANQGDSTVTDDPSADAGWLYNATTGSFQVRDANYSAW